MCLKLFCKDNQYFANFQNNFVKNNKFTLQLYRKKSKQPKKPAEKSTGFILNLHFNQIFIRKADHLLALSAYLALAVRVLLMYHN
jgi:hypothetical protein